MLSHKHIIEDATPSLARLQVNYIDTLFAHRYDTYTPIEETCRPFNWLIEQGTSEQIMEVLECCDRLELARPIAD